MKRLFSASLRLCGLLLLLTAYCSLLTAQTRDFTRLVNPFIGTGAHGHTFPGATMPFGMVQLSPDTRIDNWDGSSGYHYSDDIIYGFSHTHLSGTGIPDGCDVLMMPTVGELKFFAKEGDKSVNGYASKFSHGNEKAEPGYYSVKLDDDGIFAELTATKRVGLHRYTFPKTNAALITLDLKWRDRLIDSELSFLQKENRIEGFRSSSSWTKNQRVYFVAEFSKPVVWFFESTNPDRSPPEDFKNKKAVIGFETTEGEQVLVKVAISFVSIEGARKNLEAELPHWDFDKVRADARAAWNKELSKIEVSGGTPEQTTNFYTALYHTMIQPNVFNDVDGKYLGHDRKVHQLPAYLNRGDAETQRGNKNGFSASQRLGGERSEHYTVFSLWDTFRAAHPLYTIIDQKRTVDYINSFIRIYEQGGRLPVWELWGEETDTMIGYHAVSVIADAMAKGIKGFEYEKAYAAAKHSAELDHFGLAAYKRRGYISMEDENESVSRTLEYAYNDWCIAQMAIILRTEPVPGYPGMRRSIADAAKANRYRDDEKRFLNRSHYFENLFDATTGFFRPKKNGGFVEPFAPNEVTFGFTEGNSWQYSFFVPHDVPRLIELMGGREKFAAKLDELFTTTQKLAGREQADLTGLIGQYAHGNEPSHATAYLFGYAGQAWKTQKYVRQIMDEFYKPTPDGLIGNEDCGQMSAWYVLSSSGFYPVAPGRDSYQLGTPLFKEIKFNLENGETFIVSAPNVSSKNIYVTSAKLNGKPINFFGFSHPDLMEGGVLEFEMSYTPDARPGKLAVEATDSFTAVPVITAERTFSPRTTVSLSTITPNASIRYTIDGTRPTMASPVYSSPFSVDRTVTVKAVAIGPDGLFSFPVEAVLTKRPNDWTVKVTSGYSRQYTGGGDQGIVDGIRGTTNFASGEWQGIQGKPYEAVVDLKQMTDISEVGASFLQVAGPWIWMPDRVEFEVSSDGARFARVAEIKPAFPVREMTPTVKEYRQAITPVKGRYVRMRAFNFGKIPSWHPGAGGDPWIFVDEIFIAQARTQ